MLVQLYRLATKMKKDFVDAYINRGDVLIHLNRSNEALEEYRKAIQHGPTNTMAFFNVRHTYSAYRRWNGLSTTLGRYVYTYYTFTWYIRMYL